MINLLRKYQLLLFHFCLLLIYGCQQFDAIQPTPEEPKIVLEELDPKESADLDDLIQSLSGKSQSGRVASQLLENIDYTKAVKVTNEHDSTVRYSLNYFDEYSNGFSNIVFKTSDKVQSAYLTTFIPRNDYVVNPENLLDNYSGEILVRNIDLEEVIKFTFENGKLTSLGNDKSSINGRRACDEEGELFGGGGSSGGGGWIGDWIGAGGSSGSGSSGSGGGYICYTIMERVNGELKVKKTCIRYSHCTNLDDDEGLDLGDDGGEGPIGLLIPPEFIQNMIDNIQNPEELRIAQLQYIRTHNSDEGRAFANDIEDLLNTPGIDVGEVSDINYIVNEYYEDLIGRLIMAHFSPVADAAHPFIQLALIETGTGVLFQAVKGLLSIRWGVQLAKIGINSTSITNLTNRLTNAVKIALDGKSVNLTIGGRNLYGSSGLSTTTSSKVAYRINGVTTNEAKAIFNDIASGRQVTKTDLGGGKFIESTVWESNGVKSSITFRNFSRTGNLGDPVIDLNVPAIKNQKIELKFFL